MIKNLIKKNNVVTRIDNSKKSSTAGKTRAFKPAGSNKSVQPEKPEFKKNKDKQNNGINYNSNDGICALYRALSKLSVCSRSAAKEIISAGRVKINGEIIRDFLHSVNLKKDKIKIDEKPIAEKKYLYVALNKPAGYEAAGRLNTKGGLKNVYNLVPFARANDLDTAGRLDKQSRGLLILTNDNGFLEKISGGETKIAKFYIIKTCDDIKNDDILKEFASGVEISVRPEEIVKTAPCTIKRLAEKKFEVITVHEYNGQIRKMFEYFNIKIEDLFRYRIGRLKIEDENEGNYFNIEPKEVI